MRSRPAADDESMVTLRSAANRTARSEETDTPTTGDSRVARDEHLRLVQQLGNRAATETLARDRAALPIGQSLTPLHVLGLQHTVGNRVVSRLLAGTASSPSVQREDDETVADPAAGSKPSPDARSTPAAPEASAAKRRWATVRSGVDKSRSFNKGVRGTAVMEGVRAGVRAEKEKRFGVAEGPERKPRSDATTHTAGGAWLANQMGRKDVIGDAEEYVPFSERSKHLEQFLTGAHAFITPQIHKNIHNLNEDPKSNWGGWGADYNFVAPLSKADELVKAAAAPGARGIFDLEKALGVPKGQWVSQCAPDYAIYRYKIMDPKALNIRIPSGKERNAYGSWWKGDQFIEGEWNPGGKTSGGASEAVIDKISLDSLQTLGKDVLDIVPDSSMAANTKRVLEAERGVAPAAAPTPSAAPSAVVAPPPTAG